MNEHIYQIDVPCDWTMQNNKMVKIIVPDGFTHFKLKYKNGVESGPFEIHPSRKVIYWISE